MSDYYKTENMSQFSKTANHICTPMGGLPLLRQGEHLSPT